jgi:hypothetical protein
MKLGESTSQKSDGYYTNDWFLGFGHCHFASESCYFGLFFRPKA